MDILSTSRKLKAAVIQKNALRREMEKKMSQVAAWKQKELKARNHHRKRRYLQTMQRVMGEIKGLNKALRALNAQLEGKLREELDLSDAQTQKLREQYEREYDQMIRTRARLADVAEGEEGRPSEEEVQEEGAAGQKDRHTAQKLVPSQKVLSRLMRKRWEELSEELPQAEKRLKKGKKEVRPGDQDRMFFQHELERILLEQKVFK